MQPASFEKDLNTIQMYIQRGSQGVDLSRIGEAISHVSSISLDQFSAEQRNKLCTILRQLANQDKDKGSMERKDVVVIHPLETFESAIRDEAMRLVRLIEDFAPFDNKLGTDQKEREVDFSNKHLQLQKDVQDWINQLKSPSPSEELEKQFITLNDAFIQMYKKSLKEDLSTQFKDNLLKEIKSELTDINNEILKYYEKKGSWEELGALFPN